ncbi:DUF3626 domain-containing protein [Heyndrickxia sporothermodurans]
MENGEDSDKQLMINKTLTLAQTHAIDHINSAALKSKKQSVDRIVKIFEKYEVDIAVKELLSIIFKYGRINLNFHPDRVLSDGRTVIEGLLDEGRYLSQFATHVTNGSQTAYLGGDRDSWEQTLFGGAYQLPGVRGIDRPKYGSLNLMNYADGGSPRFGSCHFRLKPSMMKFCTFTFGDSYTNPNTIGTKAVFEPLLADLLTFSDNRHFVLGSYNMKVPLLIKKLQMLEKDIHNKNLGTIGRSLDDYIEAQIHGNIDLSNDIEAIIADSSYKKTEIENLLKILCSKYSIELYWHSGFEMAVKDVPADFRGPLIPLFAERLVRMLETQSDRLDAYTLGKAAATLHFSPEIWEDWGTPDQTFQHLKQLWHILVKFGSPCDERNQNVNHR